MQKEKAKTRARVTGPQVFKIFRSTPLRRASKPRGNFGTLSLRKESSSMQARSEFIKTPAE